MRTGFVVIGRNEGERLKQCLLSLPEGAPVVYVDSGSTDGSIEWTARHGFTTIYLNCDEPFTAARGRNAGFAKLMSTTPDTEYVQFIDGDCELDRNWPAIAGAFLDTNLAVAAVFGRRRERFPTRSVYNYLCDLEWDVPVGEARAFGGDVLIRSAALAEVGGYRNDLIAGEEPELGIRLRTRGWTIQRIEAEMTRHDAAILHFRQWWRRTVRSGYAFAQGSLLHGAGPEKHWVWESRRALLWGAVLPLFCLISSILLWPWGCVLWLIYPLQTVRRMLKISGSLRECAIRAYFETLSRFPEAVGQIKFFLNRVSRRQGSLIEYKSAESADAGRASL